MTQYAHVAKELWMRQMWAGVVAITMAVAFFGMSVVNNTVAAVFFTAASTLTVSIYFMEQWRQLALFLSKNTSDAHAAAVSRMLRSYDDFIQIHGVMCRLMRIMTNVFMLGLAPLASWALRYNAEYARLVNTSPWLQADPSWQERVIMSLLVFGMRLYFEGGRSVSNTWRVASVVGCVSVLLLYLSNAYTISMNWRFMGVKDPYMVFWCELLCGVSAFFICNELMMMVTISWLMPETTFVELYKGLRQCSDALLLSGNK